jgi:hypothetical protein
MTTHTPGPWIFSNNGHGGSAVMASNHRILGYNLEDANARLIAAAPDLLAAAKGLVEAYHNSIHGRATFSQATKLADAIDAARAAIAKAEGVS